MGTDYKLFERDGVELSIDEMSNRLSFTICGPRDKVVAIDDEGLIDVETQDMEPEEAMEVLVKGLLAVSYWTVTEVNFRKHLRELLAKHHVPCKLAEEPKPRATDPMGSD